MKNLKKDHSPLDSAVYSTLHSIMYGLVFSVSMFNKNLEPSKFNFKKKLEFTGRNILALSAMTATYKYLSKSLNSTDGKRFLKNKLNIKNESLANFLSFSLPSGLSTFLAYKIYIYKNSNIFVEKPFFIALAFLLFIGEYISLGSKKN
jgi:hypothetical protein